MHKCKQMLKRIGKDRMRRILSFALIFICLLSAGYIVYKTVFLKSVNDTVVREAQILYIPETPVQPVETSGDTTAPDKFAKLKAVNPNVIGWIQIPGTVVDYPVLQSISSDPLYYLYRDFKQRHSVYGSIFIDAGCRLDGRFLILYGHNMNDGSMFHEICRYKTLDYYKAHPVLTFDTSQGDGQWKIFSVFATNTLKKHGEVFDYTRTEFADDDDFLDFVSQLSLRSLIDTQVDVRATDQILLLSTCSYEYKGFRTVVAARRVRPGESSNVDTTTAKMAADPMLPGVMRK